MTLKRPVRVLELRSVRGTGGGPEKTILLGAARSAPDRIAVTVCYIRDVRDSVFRIDERAGALGVDYVEVSERHSFDPSIWPALRRVVRDRGIDIVHAHDYKTDLLALALRRVESVIPLATAHGWAGHSWKEEWFYYPADRWLLTRFPKVIVVSPDMRDLLVARGAAGDHVEVVPNGIDHLQFRRDPSRVAPARQRYGVDPGDVVIGAVGRLESEKNYALLLDAFRALAQQFPTIRLLIAGDGSLRASLQSLAAQLGVAGRCHLLGQVTDVVEFHHACDLFVMCSDNEGSPNAVLEAMAMETPIVATEVGGVRQLIEPNVDGLLLPRRDSHALSAAVRRVITDAPAARTRAARARLKVETQLSFERRMARVEGIYAELMARCGAGLPGGWCKERAGA